MKARKINLQLDNIVISGSFIATPPASEKILKRYDAWKATGEVPGTIIIDENRFLIDGYASYLVHRMIGSERVTAIRITSDDKALRRERDELLEERALVQALVKDMGVALKLMEGAVGL